MQAAVLFAVVLLAVTLAAEDASSPSLRGTSAPSAAHELDANLSPAGANNSALEVAVAAASLEAGNHSEDALGLLLTSSGGWYQGGDKVWGSGTGIENVNSGNVGYYDQGMAAAHARCGDASCALIVNPPGHRTVEVFHIHFFHYAGYGASLKSRLEDRLCGGAGSRTGGLPCGGTAAFFPGFPGVFSSAMKLGSIHGASIIAWPASCGGSGTIVQLAFGCSIEHQIRGDFNPALR